MSQDLGSRVLAARGDPVAINAIIKDYQPFIASEASKLCGGRRMEYGVDDELSCAMWGFFDAVNTYEQDKSGFLHYASIVMRRKIIDYLRKENKHQGNVPIHSDDEDKPGLEETLAQDDGRETEERMATQEEIAELSQELAGYGITFTDLTTTRPKQQRTLSACGLVAGWATEHPQPVAEMKRSKKLPIAHICEYTGLERKTIERHRKYIIAVIIIYSNGYEIIRGHLSKVLVVRKGGGQA